MLSSNATEASLFTVRFKEEETGALFRTFFNNAL